MSMQFVIVDHHQTLPLAPQMTAPPDVPVGTPLTPAAFYALRGDGRRQQARALALLDTDGLLAFAVACGEYLEDRYGVAVPGLAVLVGWWNTGLLTDGQGVL